MHSMTVGEATHVDAKPSPNGYDYIVPSTALGPRSWAANGEIPEETRRSIPDFLSFLSEEQ